MWRRQPPRCAAIRIGEMAMKKSLVALVGMTGASAFLAICWASPQGALAASFDCHQDTGLVERTICNDQDLSAMDDEMAYLYFKMNNNLSRLGARELLDQQRDWLDQRNECGTNSNCIGILYRGRIRAFHDVLDSTIIVNGGTLNQ
jgi:uncharacterized protein